MPYLMFCLVCVIWGSSFMLMQQAMLCLSPIGVGGWRAFGGAAVLALIALVTRQRSHFRRADLGPLLGVVLLGFAWPHSLQPALVERIGGAFVGMTVGSTPLLTILVSIPILGVWPTPRQFIGVLGALACLAALMQDGLQRGVAAQDMLLAFSTPLSYSIANSWIRRSLKHLPPLELTLACLLTAASLLLPLSFAVSRSRAIDPSNWPIAVTAVATLGVIGTGMATLMFNKLVQDQGPLFASMTTNLVPVGAVLWGWAFGEQISSTQMVALIGILVMVTIVQFGAAQSTNPVEREEIAYDDELPR